MIVTIARVSDPDRDATDDDGFLADPGIPAIARQLGILAPPVHAVAATELDA